MIAGVDDVFVKPCTEHDVDLLYGIFGVGGVQCHSRLDVVKGLLVHFALQFQLFTHEVKAVVELAYADDSFVFIIVGDGAAVFAGALQACGALQQEAGILGAIGLFQLCHHAIHQDYGLQTVSARQLPRTYSREP